MLDRWASARIFRRLGNPRYQCAHLILRSHQLSPRFHLAAVHRLGIAGRVSRGTCAGRVRTLDAERGTHLGSGSRIGDRVVVRRFVPAAGTQQLAPSLVVRNGCDASVTRAFWIGLGRTASHAEARAQPSRRMGWREAAQRTAWELENRASVHAAEGSLVGARTIGNSGSFLCGSAKCAARPAVP